MSSIARFLAAAVVISANSLAGAAEQPATALNPPSASPGLPDTPTPKASAQAPLEKLPAAEEHFVKQAAMEAMLMVQLGEVASTKGSNPNVKRFGETMVEDHGRLLDELNKIALLKSVILPTEAGPPEKAMLAELSRHTGAAFDEAYGRAMLLEHEEALERYLASEKVAHDPAVQAFIASKLAHIKDHLERVKALPGGMPPEQQRKTADDGKAEKLKSQSLPQTSPSGSN